MAAPMSFFPSYLYGICLLVTCPILIIADGMLVCSNQPATVGDTCTTTCNTGYEIQSGDVMRTCQSDGMFDGIDTTCGRGESRNVIICKLSR